MIFRLYRDVVMGYCPITDILREIPLKEHVEDQDIQKVEHKDFLGVSKISTRPKSDVVQTTLKSDAVQTNQKSDVVQTTAVKNYAVGNDLTYKDILMKRS